MGGAIETKVQIGERGLSMIKMQYMKYAKIHLKKGPVVH